MQIDYEYLKELLDVFLKSEEPTVNWKSFESLRNGDKNKLVFHIKILEDKKLIEGALREKSLGIIKDFNSSKYIISVVPWRLTADGHDFAVSLNKPTVLTTIKEKFQTEGLSVVIDVVKTIVSKQAEKLLLSE